MSKGSRNRTADRKRYAAEFERIFRKRRNRKVRDREYLRQFERDHADMMSSIHRMIEYRIFDAPRD